MAAAAAFIRRGIFLRSPSSRLTLFESIVVIVVSRKRFHEPRGRRQSRHVALIHYGIFLPRRPGSLSLSISLSLTHPSSAAARVYEN